MHYVVLCGEAALEEVYAMKYAGNNACDVILY